MIWWKHVSHAKKINKKVNKMKMNKIKLILSFCTITHMDYSACVWIGGGLVWFIDLNLWLRLRPLSLECSAVSSRWEKLFWREELMLLRYHSWFNAKMRGKILATKLLFSTISQSYLHTRPHDLTIKVLWNSYIYMLIRKKLTFTVIHTKEKQMKNYSL